MNIKKQYTLHNTRDRTVIQGTGWQEIQEQEPSSKADGRRFNPQPQNTNHGHRARTRSRGKESDPFGVPSAILNWADVSADTRQQCREDKSRRPMNRALTCTYVHSRASCGHDRKLKSKLSRTPSKRGAESRATRAEARV